MRYIEKPLALFFFSTSLLTSQWWYYPNPYPSEKRFEDQSFYFSPTYVNPYGVDEFSSALSGIVDHPLMNLQINPAGITSADQNTYLYFDYRTNKDLARKNYAGIRPADQYVFGPILYPYYPGTTKLSVEPAFSSAVLGKLFPESIPELTLGISYELISQSEPFYPIENYISNPYAMETARDVSYDGIDQVRNTGHFIALFSGYRLTDDLSVGARLGRSLFERSGKYGPQVRSTSGSASSSFYSNDNDRGQDYHLWDASLGVQLQLSDRILIGATAGYFTGDVTQSELYRSINNSLYTASSLSYESVTDNTRNWKHTGNGFSLGANSRAHLTSTVTITASYTYSIQDRDLTLSANDKYDYTSVNQISPNDYRYGNYSLLKSYGNGSRALTGNRLAAALILKNERKLSFTVAIHKPAVHGRQSIGHRKYFLEQRQDAIRSADTRHAGSSVERLCDHEPRIQPQIPDH
ncbi:MAG: hypothetical protein HYV29_11015 [Ignavibacteriales bacterium]|nr:hypothetical protein [Ignavibacteriales bacterium]